MLPAPESSKTALINEKETFTKDNFDTNEDHSEENDLTCSQRTTNGLIPTKPTNLKIFSDTVVKYSTLPVLATLKTTRNICSNPSLIIGYTHVILNIFITLAFIYCVGFLIYFLKIDVLYKINEKREMMRVITGRAQENFRINRCDPSTRVPALEKQCAEWDNIIRNGFSALNYTKIIFELLADGIDSFVSKVTYKTLGVVILIMVFYLRYRR